MIERQAENINTGAIETVPAKTVMVTKKLLIEEHYGAISITL